MSDFTFTCPHCKQSLAVSNNSIGESIACPTCNSKLTVHLPLSGQAISGTDTPFSVNTPTKARMRTYSSWVWYSTGMAAALLVALSIAFIMKRCSMGPIPHSGLVWESVASIEFTHDAEVLLLRAGNVLRIAPIDDNILTIVTHRSSSRASTSVGFRIGLAQADIGAGIRYRLMCYLFAQDSIYQQVVGLGGIPWPQNRNEVEASIRVGRGFTGSGFVYVFADDASDKQWDKPGRILSNIVRLPVCFVSSESE